MSTSKLMFAAHARQGMTRHEATAYLRDHHGPLVKATATNRQRLKTYIQNYAVDTELVPGATLAVDWIIESWRDFSVTLPEPPTAPDAILLREDEARFPDRSTLITLQVVEEPVWAASPTAAFASAPAKVFSYFRRAPGHDEAEFAPAWEAAAIRLGALPVFQRHALSFVRNRTVPGQGANTNITHAPSAAVVPPYDGVDIWRFATVADAEALFSDPDFAGPLADYVGTLFDPDSIFRMLTTERVVFDDVGIDPAARSSVSAPA